MRREVLAVATSIGDPEIRQALRSWLSIRDPKEPGTVVLDEVGICRGQGRIDVVVVDQLLHGYEIKSDRDDLRRLDGQVQLYSRILDRATIVVGTRYLSQARTLIPGWWGILLIDPGTDGLGFKTVRPGRNNPHRDPRSLVELLWRDNAIALLRQHNVAQGILGKPRRLIWDRIYEHFGEDEISDVVRDQLKARVTLQDPVPLS